jgi:HAD superfamily hydrolase (TIGR01509 family)
MIKYKNIILDLGGVILDIDYNITIEAFRQLGIKDASFLYSKSSQIKLFDELEKGNISEDVFFSEIRKIGNTSISDQEIRNAWNALLIGLPIENVNLLKELKKDHRLFLLSNTNSIHEKAYRKMIFDQFGNFIFDELFDKMYLSHHLHMRKPDMEIFQYVLKDGNMNPDETIFIDDSPQHVEGGKNAGIRSFHLKDQRLTEFFRQLVVNV